ncbi:hypothetical protein [Acetobacterium wieringae]|uniref:hypothetical protein n=1 Tax=Acetobacterium wieringae TaxID=52694 RepID=UPI003158190F
MNYSRLRKLSVDLKKKQGRTREEDELLKELKSLDKILEQVDFSLAVSSKVCPTCGHSLEK